MQKPVLGIALLAIAASIAAPASAAVRIPAASRWTSPSQPVAGQGRVSPDSKARLLYVGDNANSQISVFNLATKQQSPKPIATITAGLGGPQGLTTDRAGNLYVANFYTNTVSIYAPGASLPKATLSTGLNSPTDVKVDGFGNIYVANSPGFGAQSFILEFPAGSSSPTSVWYTPGGNQIISGFSLLNSTMQGQTSIYAAAYTVNPSSLLATGVVLSCYPGNATCVQVGSKTYGQTGGIAIEQSPGGQTPFQYLVVDLYVPGIDVITNQQQSGQLVTNGTPEFVALNAARTDLFVVDNFYGRVTEYNRSTGKILNQFYPAGGHDTTAIFGVAVSPAGTYH